MKKIFLLIIAVIFGSISYSQNIETPSTFYDSSLIYFQEILELLPSKNKEKWEIELKDINQNISKIFQEQKELKEVYEEAGANTIYAFKLINSLNDYKIPRLTELVNRLGAEIIKNTFESPIDSIKRVLNDKLKEYENTENAELLFNDFKRARILDSRLGELNDNKPIKFRINYAPKKTYMLTPIYIKIMKF